MALTAKKVYAILKRQISDMEAKLNSPVRYRGTVATADLLPLNPDIGDMYNIESKSVYGEAGMNVAWNGVVWDTMGAPIDMSLYLTKEEAEAVIQRLVTEYFEKNPVKPGATTEQAQQIEQNKADVASLKTDISTKITKFYKSNQGETHVTDSDNGKIMDMMIYGKSSQDGTPTPENSVEIKSVVNPTVKVTNEDGLKVQSVTLNNITLNAIPVKSGGNVTIDGQQYIADYVDVERGKVIRNILKWRLGDLKYGFNNAVWHMNISKLGIDGSKIGLSNMFKIQNGNYNGVTTSELYIAYDGKAAALNMRGMTDEEFKKWLREKNPEVYNVLTVAEEIPITPEETLAFKQLMTYYPVTNISVNSEQLDGYTVFNYPTPFEDEWNKTQKEIGGLKEETSSLKEDVSLL